MPDLTDKRKPQILIFIDWFDPAYKAGGPVVSVLNLVKALGGEFNFHIFTGCREYGNNAVLPVETDKWVRHAAGASVYYCSAPGKAAIAAAMEQINPDKVYINGMFSGHFSVLPLMVAKRKDLPVIVAPRGMLSSGSFSVKKYKKAPFIFIMKLLGYYRGVTFQATGEAEEVDIRQRIGAQVRLASAPNLPKQIQQSRLSRVKEPGKLKLVFIGRVAPEKNLLFAIERVLEFEPNVSLNIIGPVYNELYYRKCINLVQNRGRQLQITYRGEMHPDHLAAEMKNYHALILPSTGENYGHAIVESLAAGLPVVISDRTPWRFSTDQHAGFALSLDDIQPWRGAVEFLQAMDQSTFNDWSDGAYKYALHILSDNKAIEQNRQIFRSSGMID